MPGRDNLNQRSGLDCALGFRSYIGVALVRHNSTVELAGGNQGVDFAPRRDPRMTAREGPCVSRARARVVRTNPGTARDAAITTAAEPNPTFGTNTTTPAPCRSPPGREHGQQVCIVRPCGHRQC